MLWSESISKHVYSDIAKNTHKNKIIDSVHKDIIPTKLWQNPSSVFGKKVQNIKNWKALQAIYRTLILSANQSSSIIKSP